MRDIKYKPLCNRISINFVCLLGLSKIGFHWPGMHSESCCSHLNYVAKYKFSFPHVSTRWRSPVNVLSRLQVDSEASILTSSGESVKYLRDPRPHFGVAHSSRSVSFPLWDSDRPREMKEEDEEEERGMDSVSCCPHCHLGLQRDTLRWHEVTTHIHTIIL